MSTNKTFKENTKYLLTGHQPIGIDYTKPRTEIAEWKNGAWYPYGCGKMLCNFTIENIKELKN